MEHRTQPGSTLRGSGIAGRLGACLLVAFAMMAAHQAGLLAPVENQILQLFMTGEQWSAHIPRAAELAVIAFVSLAPAILRIEQPLVMLAFGSGIAFIYFLIVSIAFLTLDIALPISASLLGLFCSSTVVETLAWSEERRGRKALEQLELSKQQFTDMLVHDLRRRMSSILMALTVLEKRTSGTDDKNRELMDTMRASAERMLLLTGNLLDVRRMEESRLPLRCESVSLRNLVQESAKDLRSTALLTGTGIQVVGHDEVTVSLDRGVFLRVLANLLWNALQHAREGTDIELGYGMRDGRTAFVHVANRGICIPAEDRARIFSAFVSGRSTPKDSRAASTGLGLTFCKLATEAHGGTIELDSPWPPHDDGVLVRVLLPLTT